MSNPKQPTREAGERHAGQERSWIERLSVEQITGLSDRAVQANLKSDTSFIEEHYADDATVIHSDGRLSTKAQQIENLISGALKYESIAVRERKIRIYGSTAVVVTMSSAKGVLSGKPFSGDYRSTRIWVNENGNWKIVAFQSTRVASASQRANPGSKRRQKFWS